MFDSDRGLSLPNDDFACKCDDDGGNSGQRFVRSVDQFLRFLVRCILLSRARGGDDHRVNYFKVRFCFTIDGWISRAES